MLDDVSHGTAMAATVVELHAFADLGLECRVVLGGRRHEGRLQLRTIGIHDVKAVKVDALEAADLHSSALGLV